MTLAFFFFFSPALLSLPKGACGKVLVPQTLAFSSGGKKALLFYGGLEAQESLLPGAPALMASPSTSWGAQGLSLLTLSLLSKPELRLSALQNLPLSFLFLSLFSSVPPHETRTQNVSEVSPYSRKGQFSCIFIRVDMNKIDVETSRVGSKLTDFYATYLSAIAAFLLSTLAIRFSERRVYGSVEL